ncbi:hypothetical protein L914_07599, partial [Phytophthora nicotianae]
KVGKFGHAIRAGVPVENAEFEFDEELDSFERVYSLAEEKISSTRATYTTTTTGPT